MSDPLEDPEDAEDGRELSHHPSAGDLRRGRPKGSRLGPEKELELVRLYRDEGVSGTELARRFGCSDTNVYLIIGRHGARKPKAEQYHNIAKIPEADAHAVAWRYVEAREQILSIAGSYGCSAAVLYKFLTRHGVPRRDPALSAFAKGPRNTLGYARGSGRAVRSPHMERRLREKEAAKVAELNRATEEMRRKAADVAKADAAKFQAWRAGIEARPQRSTEGRHGLPAVEVKRRVIPTLPEASKAQASTRNGQVRAPLRLRFPPLPGEPGYVSKRAA